MTETTARRGRKAAGDGRRAGEDHEMSETPETNTTGRAQHLAWSKERALEYADRGDTPSAMSSLIQDLGRHPETASSVDVITGLMMPLAMIGEFEKPGELRRFIEGFN
jgi:hypothetical protein